MTVSPAADGMRYCLVKDRMVDHNQVELLVDGEAFREMLAAIAAARHTILMESYIFEADQVGEQFLKALGDAVARGVLVCLTVDAVGTISVPESFWDRVRAVGVHLFVYHPVVPWRRGFNLFRRNHRKSLVVDGQVGFLGGINIGVAWLSEREGGKGWHDIHAKVEGPVVVQLTRLSLTIWKKYGPPTLPYRRFESGPASLARGDMRARIIGSREFVQRAAIRRSYIHAIKQARHYIYIANAYFLPDMGVRRALRNAVKRGVDVRVMVPKRGDVWPVQMAAQWGFGRLLRKGIRIFAWRHSVLHAKTAVIDDWWATVGSYNLDRRSLSMNLEVNLNVINPTLAKSLRRVFEADQQQCDELEFKKWQKRPWWQKAIERFFYLFRRLM